MASSTISNNLKPLRTALAAALGAVPIYPAAQPESLTPLTLVTIDPKQKHPEKRIVATGTTLPDLLENPGDQDALRNRVVDDGEGRLLREFQFSAHAAGKLAGKIPSFANVSGSVEGRSAAYLYIVQEKAKKVQTAVTMIRDNLKKLNVLKSLLTEAAVRPEADKIKFVGVVLRTLTCDKMISVGSKTTLAELDVSAADTASVVAALSAAKGASVVDGGVIGVSLLVFGVLKSDDNNFLHVSQPVHLVHDDKVPELAKNNQVIKVNRKRRIQFRPRDPNKTTYEGVLVSADTSEFTDMLDANGTAGKDEVDNLFGLQAKDVCGHLLLGKDDTSTYPSLILVPGMDMLASADFKDSVAWQEYPNDE